jgi:hypothetical protein
VKRVTKFWVVALLAVLATGLTGWLVLDERSVSTVSAQGYTAPSEFTVAGVPLAAGQTVTITDTRPTIAGKAAAGSTVSIRVSPEDISFTAAATQAGTFSARVPSELALGTHSLVVNEQTIGSFVIAQSPAPPSTGSGTAGDGRSATQLVLFALVGVFGSAAIAMNLRNRITRR